MYCTLYSRRPLTAVQLYTKRSSSIVKVCWADAGSSRPSITTAVPAVLDLVLLLAAAAGLLRANQAAVAVVSVGVVVGGVVVVVVVARPAKVGGAVEPAAGVGKVDVVHLLCSTATAAAANLPAAAAAIMMMLVRYLIADKARGSPGPGGVSCAAAACVQGPVACRRCRPAPAARALGHCLCHK